MNATIEQLGQAVQVALESKDAALSKLHVRVVTRWAGVEGDMHPHHSVLNVGGVVYGAWTPCQPPVGWHAWKAVAVGLKADVDAYRTADAEVKRAVQALTEAARAAA